MEEFTLLNQLLLSDSNKSTTAIFTKLLATKMVANSFLGRSKSRIKICCFEETFPSFTSKSAGVSENKATSEPEIKAEQTNNKTRTIIPKKWEKSTARNKNKLEGSGSKFLCLIQLKMVNRLPRHPPSVADLQLQRLMVAVKVVDIVLDCHH